MGRGWLPHPQEPHPLSAFQASSVSNPNFQTPQGLKTLSCVPTDELLRAKDELAESLSSLTEQVVQCFDAIVNHLIPLEFYIC